jgi:hypothetical protein
MLFFLSVRIPPFIRRCEFSTNFAHTGAVERAPLFCRAPMNTPSVSFSALILRNAAERRFPFYIYLSRFSIIVPRALFRIDSFERKYGQREHDAFFAQSVRVAADNALCMLKLIIVQQQKRSVTGFKIMAHDFADPTENRRCVNVAVQQCVFKACGLKNDAVHSVCAKPFKRCKKFIAIVDRDNKKLHGLTLLQTLFYMQ